MTRKILASATLALGEIRRQPGRGGLLAITLAITVAAWLGLSSLAAPFVGGGDGGSDSAINVSNARGDLGSVGPATVLPVRYAAQIAALPGVRDVRYMDLLPLICRPPTGVATLNALGGTAVHKALQGDHVSAALEAKWNADPMGALVGAKLAAKCGWRAGMTVSPPNLQGHPVQIHVTGVYHSSNGMSDQVAMTHYAYANRNGSMAGRDKVVFITVDPKQPRDANALAARIEKLFAASDPPVVAHTDATTQSALGEFGKVQQLLALVMAAVFLCTLLVFASVLAHAATERRRDMAVMQVLGFRRAWLFGNLALEFAAVIVVGSAAGVGLGLGALLLLRRLGGVVGALFGGFAAPPWAWHWLPAWLLALLVAALIAPALTVARVRPIDYQRT